MKKFINIIPIILTFIIISCTSVSTLPEHNIEKSRDFKSSKENVWGGVISTFGDLNLPIRALEKSSWIIQSEGIHIKSAEVIEYTTTESGCKEGIMSFTVYLKSNKDTNLTNVTVTANFSGHLVTYDILLGEEDQGWEQLVSNGVYERKIFFKLENWLKNK